MSYNSYVKRSKVDLLELAISHDLVKDGDKILKPDLINLLLQYDKDNINEEIPKIVKSARAQRSEDRKNVKTTVIKCTLNTICKNERMKLLIQEMIRVYTHLYILSFSFLLYYITRELSKPDLFDSNTLLEIDSKFIGKIIRVAANLKDETSKYNYFNEARTEFKGLLDSDYNFIERGDRTWISNLIADLKIQMITCVLNSNKTRFYNIIKKWVYWRYKQEHNGEKMCYNDFRDLWVLVSENIPTCNNEWISGILNTIRTKMPSFCYDLKGRLPIMHFILNEYETHNAVYANDPKGQVKVFPLLPMSTWDSKYTPITTTTLKSMIYSLEKDTLLKKELDLLFQDELWSKYFNFNKVLTGKRSLTTEF